MLIKKPLSQTVLFLRNTKLHSFLIKYAKNKIGSLHLDSSNYSTKGARFKAVLRVALGSVTTAKWMQMYLQLHMLGE